MGLEAEAKRATFGVWCGVWMWCGMCMWAYPQDD